MAAETTPTGDDQETSRLKRLMRLIRNHHKITLVGIVVVLLGAVLGTWVTETGPFSKQRYCWGSWAEDSGPYFLGHGSRTSEETAPTPQRTRGRCDISVHSSDENTEVTVSYGPAPNDAAKRMEWIVRYLGGGATPLPDGLPGATGSSHGLLVLPKQCDARDGLPTAVTLDSTQGLSDPRAVAELLISVANHGMKAAGCAPAKPLHISSPVLTLPHGDDIFSSYACGIKGMVFDTTVLDLQYQVGAVTRDLQSCSVWAQQNSSQFLDALMVAQPRMSALFDGTTGTKPPAPGWRGTGVFADTHRVVRAECAGRPMTLLTLGQFPSEPDYLAFFANAVAQRLGCSPVAPAVPGDSHR